MPHTPVQSDSKKREEPGPLPYRSVFIRKASLRGVVDPVDDLHR
jgi:hypothetical protein